MSSFPPLLEPSFLRKLDTLRLVPRRAATGQASGNRRSVRRGASVEFADYREYVPGDDLRSVDWNAYGRLEKLYVKLFVDEQDLALHLLIDTSMSMRFGAPATKFLYARQMAAALGYIALARGDRVSAAGLSAVPGTVLNSLRGQPGIAMLFAHLQRLTEGGADQLSRSLTRYAAQSRSPGIAVVFSDFYDDGWFQGLQALRARRFQIVLCHILTPDETSPAIAGEVRLVDAETGEAREVSVSPVLIEQYHHAFNAYCARLEDAAKRYDMTYVRISTSQPLLDAIQRLTGVAGILR